MTDTPNLPTPPNVPRPKPTRRWFLHGVLFFATFLSAVLASALHETGGRRLPMMAAILWQEWGRLLDGIPFAVTLMAILLAHEMGHFVAARRLGVDQSLPYFIPAPTYFGTLGALILMRTQPNDRRGLMTVACMGPFAGLLLAIPAAMWGLSQSTAQVAPDVTFGSSLLFSWLNDLVGPGVAATELRLHPVALAGWVGLFVTSLNLIPAAQLDGGHITYALFGHRQERLSKLVVVGLFVLGVLLGLSEEGLARGLIWIFWSLFLFVVGVRHPPVRDERLPLNPAHRVMGFVALVIFVLTFVPVPIEPAPVEAAPAPPTELRPLQPDEKPGPSGRPAEEFRL